MLNINQPTATVYFEYFQVRTSEDADAQGASCVGVSRAVFDAASIEPAVGAGPGPPNRTHLGGGVPWKSATLYPFAADGGADARVLAVLRHAGSYI